MLLVSLFLIINMKAILISVNTPHVCDILNKIKKLEIRRNAPKDWVAYLDGKSDKKPEPKEVLIYCTKKTPYLHKTMSMNGQTRYILDKKKWYMARNEKVVAKFTLNEVEEILMKENGNCYTNTLSNNKFLTDSCLTQREVNDYLAGNWHKRFYHWFGGYAWHIDNLEIFDKPKELSEFNLWQDCGKCWHEEDCDCVKEYCYFNKTLTRAPQSWCYVEVL